MVRTRRDAGVGYGRAEGMFKLSGDSRGAATICGYIFSLQPLNVRLAPGLSAAFWCG